MRGEEQRKDGQHQNAGHVVQPVWRHIHDDRMLPCEPVAIYEHCESDERCNRVERFPLLLAHVVEHAVAPISIDDRDRMDTEEDHEAGDEDDQEKISTGNTGITGLKRRMKSTSKTNRQGRGFNCLPGRPNKYANRNGNRQRSQRQFHSAQNLFSGSKLGLSLLRWDVAPSSYAMIFFLLRPPWSPWNPALLPSF